VWNPETDPLLGKNYSASTVVVGKKEVKKLLCKEFGLSVTKPLIVFIGRLVGEKGADLLPAIVNQTLTQLTGKVNILILGSGEPDIEHDLRELVPKFKKQFNLVIGYNEELAHRMYAGADFLLMPSRIEPCGLNQLYALKYGTVPIVNSTGGLKDTVIDMDEENGYGIVLQNATVVDACYAISRAVELFSKTPRLTTIRKQMMDLNFSWNKSASQYIDLYKSLISSEYDI
jgi:starch synthase